MGRGKTLLSKVNKPPKPPQTVLPSSSPVESKRKFDVNETAQEAIDYPQLERNKGSTDDVQPSSLEMIENDFKCLDTVLNGFVSRRQPPFFESVQDAVSRMIDRKFTLEQLNILVSLCRDAYVLDWKLPNEIGTHTKQLYVTINAYWPPVDQDDGQMATIEGTERSGASASPQTCLPAPPHTSSGGAGGVPRRVRVRAESRVKAFRGIVRAASIKNSPYVLNYGMAGDMPLSAILPAENPLSVTEEEQRAAATYRPADAQKGIINKKQRTGAVEDIMAAVSIMQQIEQQQHQIRAEQRKTLQAQDLNQLRQQVVKRSEAAQAQEELMKKHRPRLRELSLLERLPDTCDALRTLALANNRTMYSFQQLFPLLEASSSMGSYTNPKGTSTRGADAVTPYDLVRSVAKHVPAFLSIQPADSVVAQEMVRINLYAPFAQVRAQVKELQRQALREREALRLEVTALRVPLTHHMANPSISAME